jgi:hypothetical protein
VIDRTHPLSDTAQAFAYLDEGHARGKVVIAVPASGEAPEDEAGPI